MIVSTTLIAILFLVVMASVLAAGIWWNSRTATATTNATAPGGVAGALQWMGERAPAAAQSKDSLRRSLSIAGYRGASAQSAFRGVQYVSVLALAVVGFFSGALAGGDSFLGGAALGALGYFLPERVLKAMGERRRRKLRAALPPALDLMVLSVEAGQSLDMALMETARGIRTSHPEIAAELNVLTGDLRANTSRADSLKAFSERSGEPELKKLANLLSDGDRFGTTLAPALRNHAKYLRVRMRQQAQEAARKVGVKLIFPVFFLIFPSVILVTLGPAVIMVAKQMKTYLAM